MHKIKANPVVVWDPFSNPAAGLYGFKRRKGNPIMGLLKWVKRQWDAHRDQKDEARFNQGFHWAARHLAWATEKEFDFVCDRLEQYTNEAKDFGSYDKFDDGVREAISQFRNKTANVKLHRAGGKPPAL